MTSSHIVLHPGALERILRGPQSRAQKVAQGKQIAARWRSNIKRVTGATERSIDVAVEGDEVIVSADKARDPNSAWPYLEWGTSKMRAQSPGRRAIRTG